jgi:hypothetical protein
MEKSKMIPTITFNGGVLQIRGRSIPDDALLFYEPLIEQVNEYMKKPLNETIVRVDMDYISTDSSKILLEIMKSLNKTPNFSIEWMYDEDDEDIQELGEFYEDILKTKVKFLPKQ